ncbi:sugar transporter [Roseivivax marinus]|uniref:sugar transporter n=1 Tax=Roseivivax marinus TaxID=1379903 RepID=UPI001F03CEF6|nr:sugar transporter [Roseivivax marinus]UMA65422.1 sugar transporter [Roseivivax marinus]
MIDADRLASRIAALPAVRPRLMVAIAGPPASGKTTLAAEVAARISALGRPARHVPMDGFHLDNPVIEARGLLARKGAPETFDAAGFVHAMRRLGTEEEVVLPSFDRARDIAIAGSIAVGPETEVAVVEGNYLTFDEAPWDTLAPLWQFAVFLDVPEPVLAERLIARWRDHGLDDAQARRRAEENDLPNARRILARRLPGVSTLHELR